MRRAQDQSSRRTRSIALVVQVGTRRLWNSYRKIWAKPFFSADPVRPSSPSCHSHNVSLSSRFVNTFGIAEVERQKPNPQQHLLALYGLGPLLRSVARTDPKTGEKINKLRKSYEGQIKSFGLAGRNKPVKGERNVEEDQPGPLRRMAGSSPWGLEPDEQWNTQHARSKIEVTPDFRAKLKQAVQMQPGTVRNNEHWEDVLGFDKPKPLSYATPMQQHVAAAQPVVPRLPNGGAVRTQSQPALGSAPLEPKRQTRGKKRSYGDDSFVGYGEGYSDPEDGDDGDDYGSARKRKKVTLPASQEAF